MDKLQTQDHTLSETELFARTRVPATAKYDRMLAIALREKTTQHTILYLDKNHPPNALKKTVESIRSFAKKDSDIRLIAIIPKSSPAFSFKAPEGAAKPEHSYPFSLEFFINSLKTV